MEGTKSHLLSLGSIRKRASLLFENPSLLQNFDLHVDKLPQVADEIVKLVQRDYATPNEIPPHSRWRHFEASTIPKSKIDRIAPLLKKWSEAGVGKEEQVRRLLDLFVVGVLLDAGAGSLWKYTPNNEMVVYNRSEGLGIASFDLFDSGILSSSPENKHQCDSKGLSSLKVESLASAFQVSDSNPLVGLEGRCSLLQRLGGVCESNPTFFKGPSGDYRPGYLLDYLLSHGKKDDTTGKVKVHINVLWTVVMQGISGVWPPTRTVLDGTFLGDVWPCKAMTQISNLPSSPLKEYPGSESFVCFHKLSQWLTYSLMEPLFLANVEFEGVEDMTGLAEYRNGGLFVDYGVLELKKSVVDSLPPTDSKIPRFQVWDDVVVEWRALTIVLLDKTADLVRQRLGMSAKDLPLAKILEAGTWKAGREIAAKLRPDTKGPPIEVISDGTVF